MAGEALLSESTWMVILEALDANINSFYVMHLSLVTIPVVLPSMIVFMNANGAALVLLIKILKTKKKAAIKLGCFSALGNVPTYSLAL